MNAFDMFVAILGVVSALQLLPEIIRVLRRKSSSDFSLWSCWLGLFTQSIWLIWAIYRNIPVMIAAGVAWEIVIAAHLWVVMKYRRSSEIGETK